MTRKSETAPKSAPAATAKKATAVSRRGVAATAEAEAPKTRRTASPKTGSASTKRPAAPPKPESAPKARRKASPQQPAPAPIAHPHTVANLAAEADIDRMPDQPFAEGVEDGLDADLRQRMISERAYRLYCERGGGEGYDLDDWLQAEAEVDHLLLNPAAK
jgi:hypothetical protein